MEGRDEAGLPASELGPQQLSKEVMVAIPLATVVQRDQEEIVVLDLLEDAGTVRPPVKAAHSRGHRRGTMEVLVRNAMSSSGWSARTSDAR